ncbi:cell wall-binding protein [Fictibacillus macauensis ZFHKF-1]|uniref:Cell wall-binding protein n=1 Tax=Fictibacillus macauensis ZFHKF-1 TaxID=1196324 RepID=I8AKR7_9BACL|nr:hypothetical protein [Fictibacillus macauensis]EIT86169.1 cell wall-binding protein [Fictibacillus macauensis ZFHKF-1]
MRRVVALFLVIFVVLGGVYDVTAAEKVDSKSSRMAFTVTDAKGKGYKILIKDPKDQHKRGAYDHCSWNCAWAGISKGDHLYKGNYKIYLQTGANKPLNTNYKKSNYVYNKTRKMMYYIPSTFKGQPDLFGFAETESSNLESIHFYYVNKGKVVKVKKELLYSIRPHLIGKNLFETASYDNTTFKWLITTYTFSPVKGSFNIKKEKYYSFSKGKAIIKKWKPSWRG